jgi:hypothetical protein
MNTVHDLKRHDLERRKTPRPTATTLPVADNVTRIHRDRDFGVGYGSSSGYASSRRYADTRGQTFFRCR